MKNTDTFDRGFTPIYLGKTYAARYTMRAWMEVERRYGTISAALKVLFGEDTGQNLEAAKFFLCILTGAAPDIVSSNFNEQQLLEMTAAIQQTMMRDCPQKEETKGQPPPEEATDWDWLEYLRRYRLQMSEEEFWNSTPRKIMKLLALWKRDNVMEKDENEPEIFNGRIRH